MADPPGKFFDEAELTSRFWEIVEDPRLSKRAESAYWPLDLRSRTYVPDGVDLSAVSEALALADWSARHAAALCLRLDDPTDLLEEVLRPTFARRPYLQRTSGLELAQVIPGDSWDFISRPATRLARRLRGGKASVFLGVVVVVVAVNFQASMTGMDVTFALGPIEYGVQHSYPPAYGGRDDEQVPPTVVIAPPAGALEGDIELMDPGRLVVTLRHLRAAGLLTAAEADRILARHRHRYIELPRGE
jgi:hypothetical protein